MDCTVHFMRRRAGQQTRLLVALALATVVFGVETEDRKRLESGTHP